MINLLEKEEDKLETYTRILFHGINLESDIENVIANNKEKKIKKFIATFKESFNYNINLKEVENKLEETNKYFIIQNLVNQLLLYLNNNIYPKIRLGISKFLLAYELQQSKVISNK